MFKKIITQTLCVSLIASQVYAGDSVGNGTDPVLALSPEQIAQVQANYNLDYLKLSPKDIQKRDKKLAPIYKNYQSTTVSSVVNALEETFGMNVYTHMNKEITFNEGDVDKKEVMAAAVRFFVSSRHYVPAHGGPSVYDLEAHYLQSPFYDVRESEIGYRSSVQIEAQSMKYTLVEGSDSHFKTKLDAGSPYDLATREETAFKRNGLGIGTYKSAVYTSLEDKLFEHASVAHLLDAMKESNLKALDATIVFVNGELRAKNSHYSIKAPYRVVYPTYSTLVPIPQPVIYINESATKAQLLKMLSVEAPRIYAYNQIFDKEILPSVDDLNRVLDQYPNVIEEVRKIKGDVSRENIASALQEAFLSTTFAALYGAAGVVGVAGAVVVGTVAVPLTLAAMLASPFWCPILISTTVIIL